MTREASKPTSVLYLDALDRAARYYREALKHIIDECSHDKPRIEEIISHAQTGILSADYELKQVQPEGDERGL